MGVIHCEAGDWHPDRVNWRRRNQFPLISLPLCFVEMRYCASKQRRLRDVQKAWTCDCQRGSADSVLRRADFHLFPLHFAAQMSFQRAGPLFWCLLSFKHPHFITSGAARCRGGVEEEDMIVSSGIDPGRAAPLPAIDSSNRCGRPEIAPAVNFPTAVFICQENIRAPLGRVGRPPRPLSVLCWGLNIRFP